MLIEGKQSENINSLVWQYVFSALSNSILPVFCTGIPKLTSQIPYDTAGFVPVCWWFPPPLYMIYVLLAIPLIISLNVSILRNTWHLKAQTKVGMCFQKCRHSYTEREDRQILLGFFYSYGNFKFLEFITLSVCKTALWHLVSCYISSMWAMQLCLPNLNNGNFFPAFFFYSPNFSWNCCHYLD